ncbi:Molybdenum transport system permease protein ModB (TC 3.A.1.8.1) [hydrothermal vent metagenome]|uniref:Molybdenum transport system permease protein ModB (TC 3.A.1.8.1) n=1 Tax=hydrothermal vent metagenome TaxID=652676 RepID=A0A1W1CLR8_9ZZZZ
MDFIPFLLSFKLAGLTTLILFVIALPFAWWLSQTNSKMKVVLEAVTALPIVLPPSVLGFYLLVVFSPDSAWGEFFEDIFGVKLVFSFTGLVVASCFYSLPFMVQPLQSGFESLNKHMLEASYLAGKSKLQTIWHVALPNMKPALMTALIITFAHTVGEFGVVLMVGGSIPHETKVASVAIYEMVEVMEYDKAHIYSGIMVAISFVVLLLVYLFNHKQKNRGITV